MEKIFASTLEIPMDGGQICSSVSELEALGLLIVNRSGVAGLEYDFATVQISEGGLALMEER